MRLLLKMVVFHCYVSLPEGRLLSLILFFFAAQKTPICMEGMLHRSPNRCHELLAKRSCVKVSRCVSWPNSRVHLETIQQTFLTKISRDYWCDKSYCTYIIFTFLNCLIACDVVFFTNRFLTRWQDDFPSRMLKVASGRAVCAILVLSMFHLALW